MVDRYFLPVVKNKISVNHVVRKNHRIYAFIHFGGAFLVAFQFSRVLYTKVFYSKFSGTYVDWESPEAPKKFSYFS